MKIIGFGHYSRTGKDSTANALVEKLSGLGVKAAKMSFAWKLKQQSHELYAWAGLREPAYYDTPEGERFRDVVLPAIGKTPVEIWVAVGNMYRDHVYLGTWIDYVLKSDHGLDVLVIPDVRYPNEVLALQELGAKLIKVVRPGYGPKDTVADRALIGFREWDYVIGSSGTMTELKEWATHFAFAISGKTPWPAQSLAEQMKALSVEAPIQPVRARVLTHDK